LSSPKCISHPISFYPLFKKSIPHSNVLVSSLGNSSTNHSQSKIHASSNLDAGLAKVGSKQPQAANSPLLY
jgi:hypothetical protein